MNLLKHCIWSRINASGSGSGGGTVMTVSWHQCPEAVRRYLAGVDYNGTAYTETEITDYAPTPAVPAANTKPIGKTVDGVTYYNNVPGTAAPFASENMAGTVQPLDRLRWINSATSNMRDLGGWDCDGGTVKYGLLFRSGNPAAADEQLVIDELGVKTEVDLTADGVEAYPGKLRYVCHPTYAMYSLADKGAWRTNLRARFNSSHVPVAMADGQLVTGFIPLAVGERITVSSDKSQLTNAYTGNLQTFDADGNWVATLSQGVTGTGGWVWAEDYKSGYIVLPSSYGGNHFAGTVSTRICVAYEDIDNIVITKGGVTV